MKLQTNTREEYTEAQGELFKIAVTQIMLLKVEKLKQIPTDPENLVQLY